MRTKLSGLLILALALPAPIARATTPGPREATLESLVRAANTQVRADTFAQLTAGTELAKLLEQAAERATNSADVHFFRGFAKHHHVSPREIVRLAEAKREGEGWAIRLKARAPILHVTFAGPARVAVNGVTVRGGPGEASRTADELAKLLGGENLSAWPELVPSAYAIEPVTMIFAVALVGALGLGLADQFLLSQSVSKYYAAELMQCERDRGHHHPYAGSRTEALREALGESGITAASFPMNKPTRCGPLLEKAMAAAPDVHREGDKAAGCTQVAWFLDCAEKYAASAKAVVQPAAISGDTRMGE